MAILTKEPRKQVIDLTGPQGNAFYLLGTAIEMHYGDQMNIDDLDYRWVNDRIEYYEAEERLLNKEEMSRANSLWNKYNNKPYVSDMNRI